MSATVLDLFENWNRYYFPDTGRWLSPEPMLRRPGFQASMARQGVTTPTFAYAMNNPVGYFDVDGQGPRGWAKAFALAMRLYANDISSATIKHAPEELEAVQKKAKSQKPRGVRECGAGGAGGGSPVPLFDFNDLLDLALPPFVLTPRDLEEAGVRSPFYLDPYPQA